MKKILLAIIFFIPSFIFAQSEWEIPVTEKDNIIEQKQGKNKISKKNTIAPQYKIGNVPEIDGKVEWQKNILVANTDAESLYERTMKCITKLINGKSQTTKSRITAVNKQEKIIAAYFEEEIVFATSSFAKDFAHMRYTIIAKCDNDSINIRLCRISYKYDIGRAEETIFTAEELITDKQAFNKKGTKMYRLNGKFRKKTIDRKDEIFDLIEKETKYTSE